ncbi:MAG: ATP-binding cassette domain-containing protein, partial [Planctomycetales bacterium]
MSKNQNQNQNPSPTPLFQLRRIRKQFGETLAVDLDELDVSADEILCLLGPTGAGKSTLLRILAAVDRPTSGEALLEGTSLASESLPLATRRRITLVFQRPALLSGTVRWNVEYGLRLRDGNNISGEQVNRILDRLSLTDLAEQSARTLSGGQTQLVALARA